jgi:hypothetical protein
MVPRWTGAQWGNVIARRYAKRPRDEGTLTVPTYFEIVCQTLDIGYEDIETTDRDSKITERLQELSDTYGNVLATGGPSYDDNLTRFAYVFKYATAHADYLNTIIGRSPELCEALTKKRVDISCIGGGPGSDVLGFLKFLLSQNEKPQVTYFILDKEPAWGETWADLDAIVSEELKTSRNYFPLDVTEPESYEKLKRPFKSDIFTMLYFLSEIYKYRKKVTTFLEVFFERMKEGALLVVLDFHDTSLESWIDQCAEDGGLETLIAIDNHRINMDPIEEKNALRKYINKFGSPKLQAQVFVRVFRKK